MFDVISTWYQRYFTDKQAVTLILVLLLMFVIVVAMGSMLAPVLAGIVIAYILEWVITQLEWVRVPRKCAVICVYLIFLGLLIFSVFGLVPLLWQQTRMLLNELPAMIGSWQESLLHLPESYPEFFTKDQVTSLIAMLRGEAGKMGQYIISVSFSSIPSIISIIIYLIMVPLMVFFFLKDRDKLVNWFTGYLPKERQLLSTVWTQVHFQLGNYVRGKVAESIIVGVVSYITFALLGLIYAMVLAAAVGISVLVPYVGAAVVTIPVALVAFIQWGFQPEFFWLMLAYGVIQTLDGNILVPLLFSEAVNLHPVAIIVAILVFGGLWGFLGIFFAIPLAILVQTVINAWPRPAKPAQAQTQA